MKNTITIKDVAKRLNVSISTVSRAFNDKYDIHPDTRRRILETAKEMGYAPNPMAQHLSQHRSCVIGVVVPEFINAFFPLVISGIQSVLKEAGYQMLIMSSNEHYEEEVENVKMLERDHVDGILISLTQETRDISFLQDLNKRMPIVQFNRVSRKLNTSRIVFNDYQWAMHATEHLFNQGYKNIYYLSGPDSLILSLRRRKAFVDVLKNHRIPNPESHIIVGGIFIEDGCKVAPKILSMNPRPDALFCFNDPVAIGVMEELRKSDIKIPEDIAIMGFTESRIAKHTFPALTSVEQPAKEIGITAARQLLEELNSNRHTECKDIILDGKINIRESTMRQS
jgi:LacI family transcriptional regulator